MRKIRTKIDRFQSVFVIRVFDSLEGEVEELAERLLGDIFEFVDEQPVAIDGVAFELENLVIFEIFVDFPAQRFGRGFVGMGLSIELDVAFGAQVHDGIADAAVPEIDAADAPAAGLDVAPFRPRIDHEFFDGLPPFEPAFSAVFLRFLQNRKFVHFILLKDKNRAFFNAAQGEKFTPFCGIIP